MWVVGKRENLGSTMFQNYTNFFAIMRIFLEGVKNLILKNLTFQVLCAALLGIVIASVVPTPIAADSLLTESIYLIKTTFLSALKMLIAPMIFFSLTTFLPLQFLHLLASSIYSPEPPQSEHGPVL